MGTASNELANIILDIGSVLIVFFLFLTILTAYDTMMQYII